MIKLFFWLSPILLAVTVLSAQNQSAGSMPDLNKMMKMSPAELADYKKKMLDVLSKKAKSLAAAAGQPIDETLLPDFELKAPPRDVRRLAALPFQPPKRKGDTGRFHKDRIELIKNP